MNRLWDDLDNLREELKAKFNEEDFIVDDVVSFKRTFGSIPAKTRAIVVSKDQDYYAIMVKSEYVEGVHKDYLHKSRRG